MGNILILVVLFYIDAATVNVECKNGKQISA